MKPIDPNPLHRALAQLLCEIDRQALLRGRKAPQSEDALLAVAALEKLARAVTVQLKALAEIEAYNEKANLDQKNQKYLNYADLPPPSPEDREHIIERLRLLYNRVNAGREVPDFSERSSSTPGEPPA